VRRVAPSGARAWVLIVTLVVAASARTAGATRMPSSALLIPPADSSTFDYVVNGVHVIQRLTPGNDVVAADLYLIGGVLELTPDIAGVEDLALRAGEYGSARFPGGSSRGAMARTGTFWDVTAATDWSTVSMVTVQDEFDTAWAVFADRVVHPTLDSASIAVVRGRMIRELRLRDISPEDVAYSTADSLTFLGHPYALHPYGTEASLASLTPDIVRSYVRDHFVTSRMLLVVVGNVPRSQLEALVRASLGTLPPGRYVRAFPPDVRRRPTSTTLVARRSATNYILGYYVGPPATSRDYVAFRVATEILSSRLASAVRARSSLSYAAYAPYDDRAIASGGLYASTNAPKEVLSLMRGQLDSAKAGGYDWWALTDFEKQFKGPYLLDNETNEGQASSLARAELLLGDYRKAATELQQIRSVSASDVTRAMRTYVKDIQLVIVGDTTRIKRDWAKVD